MLRQPAQLACARGRGCGVQHAQHSQPKRCAPAAWTPARPCPPPPQVASLAGASSLRTCGRAPPRVSKLIPGRCTPLLHVTHDSVARPQVKQHTHTGTTHPSRLQQPGLSASVQAHEEQRQHSQGDAYTKRLWAGTHTKNSAVTARPLVVSSVASTGYSAMGIGVLSGVPGEACISRVLLDHKHPAERLVLAAQHSLISHATWESAPPLRTMAAVSAATKPVHSPQPPPAGSCYVFANPQAAVRKALIWCLWATRDALDSLALGQTKISLASRSPVSSSFSRSWLDWLSFGRNLFVRFCFESLVASSSSAHQS